MKDFAGQAILLHGPPKAGKTQLASHFPGKVQFIATEPGHRFLPEDQAKRKIDVDPVTGWPEFVKCIDKIEATRPKTIVIDTIAGLYSACLEWVCKENRWDHPTDAGHGKGWAAIRREFYKQLTRLSFISSKCGSIMIWIAHSRVEEIETLTSAYQKLSVSLPGQARDLIIPVPDHIWLLTYAEGGDAASSLKLVNSKRALWIAGTDKIEAGSRDPEIVKHVIKPLSKKDPYSQIIKAINEKAE